MKFNMLPVKGRITLIALSALMVSCGGGSGSDVNPAPVLAPSTDDNATQEGLPDFSIVNVTSSADTDGRDSLFVQATIANNGDIAAIVPDGWFTISEDSDDNGNYQRADVTLVPVGNQSPVLQPGESGLFDAINATPGIVKLQLRRSGTHYGQLRLNPDLSERFLNPESVVMESYTVEETDYDNNRSELISFESIRGPNTGLDCTVDAFEQNDTVDQATPIITNVIYDFNACDEAFEIIVIELAADTTYQIKQHLNDLNRTWSLTVINPEGEYILRGIRDSLITPQESGLYQIIAQTESSPDSELLLEVIEQ